MLMPNKLYTIAISALLLSSVFLLPYAFSHAQAVMAQLLSPLPLSVAAALQEAAILSQNVGIYVQEVAAGGKVLTANNINIPFSPTSNMKLVTTDAELELLGPTYSWKTIVYTDGQQIGNTLQDDLVFKGGWSETGIREFLVIFAPDSR